MRVIVKVRCFYGLPLIHNQNYWSATLLKKRLWHRCFPVNFVEFLRTPFYRTPLDDCFYNFTFSFISNFKVHIKINWHDGERSYRSEAATGGVLWNKLFLETSQYSQENTGVESLFNKVWEPATLFKKAPTTVFSSEYCKIRKNTYLGKHLQTAASDRGWLFLL